MSDTDRADLLQRISVVGGHPALDLANTLSWRHDPHRYRDNLTDDRGLATWCGRVGVIDERTTGLLESTLTRHGHNSSEAVPQVQELRTELLAALDPLLSRSGDRAQPPAVSPRLRSLIIAAVVASDLKGRPAQWTKSVTTVTDLVPLLTLSVMNLLQSAELELLKQCEGAGCGWVFFDRTRSRTRRYCSAKDCGNRERVRRHYVRTHTSNRDRVKRD